MSIWHGTHGLTLVVTKSGHKNKKPPITKVDCTKNLQKSRGQVQTIDFPFLHENILFF